MNLFKSAIKGVRWSSFTSLSWVVVGMLKISVLARFLEPQDFGLMAIMTFILGFMNLFMDLGFSSAIIHKKEISKEEYSSLFWINITISIILYGILFLSSGLVALFYNEEALSQLVKIISLNIIISALGRQFKTILQKQLNFRLIALTDLTGLLLGLAFAILLAMEGYGVYSLVYSSVLQFLITNTIYFSYGVINFSFITFKPRLAMPFFKIGIYQVGSQSLNYFNREIDILLIGKLFDAEVLGGYSLAKQLVIKPIALINPILTSVASPILSLSQSDQSKLKKLYLILVGTVSSVNFTIYLLIALLANYILLILYGEQFVYLELLLQILSIQMFFRSLGNPAGSLLVATGKTNIGFYWNLIVVTLVPVTILAAAGFGILSVAISLVTLSVIMIIPQWFFVIRKIINASLFSYLVVLIPFRSIPQLLKGEFK